jgi:two-component system sensor histidine kinase KdpD
MSGRIDEQTRPDPDTLLHRVKAEEQAQARGRLKIFFGASAGVGKTYSMLEAARARKAEGVDVIIGIVETHKRKETEALVQGLEVLPPRFIEYKNTKLREFDPEAAIKRKPALLLVDELAHTNAPGSKNAKRWEDVQELLNAGINVYTTVNVQHIESLNDVVAQITGIIVRETIPDSIIESADEIELIDLPPDDLLKRLKEGKVYLSEAAERAAVNFFRKANLTALRELALRATADRVNQQVQSIRQEQAISKTWATTEHILVCVSPSPFSARLVRAGRRMAAGLRAEWMAVYIEPPSMASLPEKARQQVQQNLRLAEQLGAETFVLPSSSPVTEIIDFARSHNITKIIIGKPAAARFRDRIFGSFVDDLIRKSGDIDVYVIKGEPEEGMAQQTYSIEPPASWSGYIWATVELVVCTAVAQMMYPYFQPELSNLIMVYLLGVAVIAARFGRGPAIYSSIVSVAAFDYFFVPPRYTFAVTDTRYFITFGVMLAVALLISSLTTQIKAQVIATLTRERRTANLYSMSRELAVARGTEKLIEIVVRHVADVFRSNAIGLLPDSDGRLVIKAGNESAFPFTARERGVAQWVFDLGRPAGLGTDTLPGAEAIYVPLSSARGPVGVLGLHPMHAGRPLTPEQLLLLEAFASQAGLAIEGDRLSNEARDAQIRVESEKSRSALLSSVSHDLRTPLASICGAADSLLSDRYSLSPHARELVQGISEESDRLSRIVSNLLEMTKLDSGAKAKKEWCPLEEIVGSALNRLDKTLQGRQINIQLPHDLPLIPMDVLMIEQVLINLLENAAKYTPPGSPLDISAAADGGGCVMVRIADRGPGLARGDDKRIFDKFYRGKTSNNASGAGLGLPICRAIIETHGGKIWAENRPGGGAVFCFTLPLTAEKSIGVNDPTIPGVPNVNIAPNSSDGSEANNG